MINKILNETGATLIKPLLLTTLLFVNLSVSGQNLIDQIQQFSTVEEAGEFVEANSEIAQLYTINSADELADTDRKLQSKKTGKIIEEGGFIYKVMDSQTALSFRASYIYLNGSALSGRMIDSLRKVILARYKEGIAFLVLVKEYTMDSNLDGDLGWFVEGSMVNEFEIAVRQHKKNDIFLVDVPSKGWYYVALKTHSDQIVTTLTILKVKTPG